MDKHDAERQAQQEEEEARQLIPESYYYPDDWEGTPLPDSPITSALSKFHWCEGYDPSKRHNLYFLSSEEIIFALGTTYHIYNTVTNTRQIYFSRDGGGIGAISVHPQRTHFAVGEKGNYPNVYIFEYPTLRLYRILSKGTERAYSTMAWSPTGTKLATVGSNPDFMLTVWDWLQQRVILKSKAFGQDVYRVSFSPTYEEQITTSGTAHIRFWKMAKTFTGLKLQGDIGKFGQVDLSDIVGYVELPDGKVVSGSEYGNILLWEGALIKAVLTLPDESPSHNGSIEIVMLQGNELLTAGTDGFIKWWDFDQIDQAEPVEGFQVPISPKREVSIGNGAEIVNLVQGDEFWLAVDQRGMLWKLANDWQEQEVIMNFHSGVIKDMVVSSDHNVAVTIGEDSTIRAWDFISMQELYFQKFEGVGLCLAWAPSNKYNQGRILAAGFKNGLARLILMEKSSFKLLGAWKVHDAPVTHIEFSKDGKHLFTVGQDNTVFFFDVGNNSDIEPVCITPLQSDINDIRWHSSGDRILLGLKSGQVVELNRPEASGLDTSHSYEVEIPQRVWTLRMMEFQKKKDEDEDFFLLPPRRPGDVQEKEKEWDPESIVACQYVDHDKFVVASQGNFIGFLYLASFDEPIPLKAIPTSPEILVTYISLSKNFIISSHVDGSIEIRSTVEPEKYLKKRSHDAYVKVTKALLSYNENYVLSVAQDGSLFVNELFPQQIIEAATSVVNPEVPTDPKFELGASTMGLDNETDVRVLKEDIVDTSIYSIQMDKLKTDEDRKRELAELKKHKKREEIAALRERFRKLQEENEAMEDKYKLTSQELRVDPEYYNMLQQRNTDLYEEVEKEVAWEKAYHQLALDKYNKYFMDEVIVERFSVRGLRTPDIVQSFRVTNPSEFLTKNLEEIQALMEEETRGHNLGSGDEGLMSPGKFSQHTVDQSDHPEETKTEFRITAQAPGQQQSGDKKVSRTQEVMESRTRAREERKRELELLKRKRPPKNVIDGGDQREIDTALATMGDFQLKTSPDYVVPEHQQINASKKRRQMFLLMESRHNLMMDLNSRLLALRENKVRLIDWIKQHNERISEINQELNTIEPLFSPDFSSDEWPESATIVSPQDIEQFAIQKAQRSKKQSGGNMYGGGAAKEQPQEQAPEVSQQQAAPRELPKKKGPVGDAEIEFKEHRDLKLLNEKQGLLADIDKRVSQFDEALAQQIEQKHLLECDLKQIDMKLLTYFQELLKLDDMEPEDNRLTEQMNKLRESKAVLMNEIADITHQYEMHKQEAEEITKQQNEIYETFNQKVDENNPHYDYLLSILDRKIKRKKKKQKSEASEDDDDEEDEDEDDDESDESDEDDDDDSFQNEDAHPSDIDMNLIDEVNTLREKRQELADNALAKTQIMQELKRRTDEIEKKEKNINIAIGKTDKEIQEFQREKMKQLNQIFVSIMLSQDQIQIVEEEMLPPDLGEAVLFTNEEREKLKRRIRELEEEKKEAEVRRKNIRIDEVNEKKKIRDIKKAREEAQKKFDAIQALKFGQKIKLDNLKYAEPSEQLAKLKNDFAKAERESIKRIEDSKFQLEATRDQLNEVTKRSTILIKTRTDLLNSIIDLNKKLDMGNQEMYKDEDENERENAVQERQKLKELLALQKREIETLKTEINLFRRKGGHIYTKITANRRANLSQPQHFAQNSLLLFSLQNGGLPTAPRASTLRRELP